MPPEPLPVFTFDGVSRETRERLAAYEALLHKWQKTLNLVGPATLPEAQQRHFTDSAQLLPLIPAQAKTLFDLGSGAGFPGLVLAILRPDLAVHLVESDERKAMFLRTVSRETGVPVTVHDSRIESLQIDAQPDIISARALAALDRLLGWCAPWAAANPDLVMIFPKGKNAAEETENAQTNYSFAVDEYASQTDPAARILRVSGVCIKAA